MRAMIMAAGVGSRLMPMTRDIPKPMIPMANRPLLVDNIELLKAHGFDGIIANLHYHADVIAGYFGDGHDWGIELHYSREEHLLGTAGGVKRCQWFLDDTFVIVSGDALTDIDLAGLVKSHRDKGALATIALKEVEDVENFGIVITSADGRIKSFQEKPRPEQALSRVANTGIYVFEPEIFDLIPPEQFYDFGKELFPLLVSKAAPFYGVTVSGYWCDVGNIETYRQAHADILAGRVNVKTEGKIFTPAAPARVLLGEGVELGKGVSFSGSVVLGAACSIGDDVHLSDTVIWDNTRVGKGCRIDKAVIGTRCQISAAQQLGAGTVLPSKSII